MKVIVSGLVVVLLLLQWRLWIGEGGVRDSRCIHYSSRLFDVYNNSICCQ